MRVPLKALIDSRLLSIIEIYSFMLSQELLCPVINAQVTKIMMFEKINFVLLIDIGFGVICFRLE